MARKWSGFLPQNLLIKEEWELLEACESRARKAAEAKLARNESPRRRTELTSSGDLQSE